MVVLAAGVIAACGSDNDGGGSTQASSAPATDTAGSGFVAEAKRNTEALYAGEDFKEPPSTSPAPKPGAKISVVVTGLAFPGSVFFSEAAKQAAKTLGWQVSVYDSKFSPDRYQEGIRQAIAAKADGILLYNIDCSLAQSALRQAKAANVPVVATESLDCDEVEPAGEPLYTDAVRYTSGKFKDFARRIGAAQADWIVAQTDGTARTIVFSQGDLQTAVLLDEGFRAQYEKCTTCEVAETVEFTLDDIGPKLQQKTEQALIETPDANAIMTPYDEVLTAGIAAAVKASGRNDELDVVGGAGYEANMDLVRNNSGQDGGYAVSIPWEGYAAMDTMVRILAGEEQANSGIGVAFFDHDHNLGTSGPATYPIDFTTAYEKAWTAAKAG
jgi:ribose transport system substrate-binding protein